MSRKSRIMKKQEIIDILSDNTKNNWLFKEADKVRYENIGKETIRCVHLVSQSDRCR